MSFVLAMDAGGTSTECALAAGDRILARIRGGSIKIIRVTPEQAQENLYALLEGVERQSGVALERVCATCAGIAGFRVPAIAQWLRSTLAGKVGGQIILSGDDEIALDGAFPGQSGVLIIAGTGSNVLARTSKGERVNVGGWGPILSDEGSGYWIGLEGLRSAMRAWDRGESTLLLEKTSALWGVDGIWGIVERSHSTPAPDFAALAPIVMSCAEEGDAVCTEVLAEGGRHLADAAVLAFRKMRALEPEHSVTAGVAFTGGVLHSSGMMRTLMIDSIRRQLPTVPILSEAADPIMGALWRARQACVAAKA